MNAGKYRHRITIYRTETNEDSEGFQHEERVPVLKTHAAIKTFKGSTLVKLGTDFEKATTNFTIRYPVTRINRDMLIEYRGKLYTIEYLNDNNLEKRELEMQAKEVVH